MRHVLLIEDEAVLRTSLVRGLQKLAELEVSGAADLGAGLAILDQRPPDLVISDIDLPDRSGLELLGELGRRHLDIPVVYVSAYLKAYRSQIPPHAKVDVLEKPVALEELRNLVVRRLRAPFEDRAPFGAPDYLQLACLGHHSVVIEVQGGSSRAEIVVVRGELWSARDEKGTGRDAFMRIVFAPGTQVSCRALRTEPGPRDIFEPGEGLLMDAARIADEGRREGVTGDLKLGPSEDLEPAAPPPSGAESAFDDAFDRAIGALLRKDYPVALAAFLEASAHRPDDPRVVVNLKRLAELGHRPQAGGVS